MPGKKLTAEDVKEIRRRMGAGESPSAIAEDFPVKTAAITKAAYGYTWKKVTYPPPLRSNHVPDQPTRDLDIPDDATPCARCGLLSLGRYCHYCYQEGYAPSYLCAPVSHPATRETRRETRERPNPYMGVV